MKTAVFIVSAAIFLLAADSSTVQPNNLTVHEWGTFTSVAGEDGDPVSWAPLSGPSDLPCFVHRLGGRNVDAANVGERMR